jgi:hypothetical protein
VVLPACSSRKGLKADVEPADTREQHWAINGRVASDVAASPRDDRCLLVIHYPGSIRRQQHHGAAGRCLLLVAIQAAWLRFLCNAAGSLKSAGTRAVANVRNGRLGAGATRVASVRLSGAYCDSIANVRFPPKVAAAAFAPFLPLAHACQTTQRQRGRCVKAYPYRFPRECLLTIR